MYIKCIFVYCTVCWCRSVPKLLAEEEVAMKPLDLLCWLIVRMTRRYDTTIMVSGTMNRNVMVNSEMIGSNGFRSWSFSKNVMHCQMPVLSS